MDRRRTTPKAAAPLPRRRKISATAAAVAVAATAAALSSSSSSSSITHHRVAVVEAFSASPPLHLSHGRPSSSISTALYMAATATPSSWDDSFFNDNDGSSNSDELRQQQHLHQQRQKQQPEGGVDVDCSNDVNDVNRSSSSNSNNNNKFVTGDALHRLRHQVLAMRLELQEARLDGADGRVRQLETAIMRAQQVDAEFVYTVSLERKALALQHEDYAGARMWDGRAEEARSALPQFQLEGLWVGRYGDMSDDENEDDDDDGEDYTDYADYAENEDFSTGISGGSGVTVSTNSASQGYELINITYVGDVLTAHKVTAGKNVPKGAETFTVDLSPSVSKMSTSSSSSSSSPDLLSPIELGDAAAEQWGCKYLQRFAGEGQVAAENFEDSQWVDGQLILVNEYFSFAWLPIGHQVFFGRPTPELILKLMKDDQQRETGVDGCETRAFLEKCWEETEHLQDDMDVSPDGIVVRMDGPVFPSSTVLNDNLYDDEDCFE